MSDQACLTVIDPGPTDVSVVIVSYNSKDWLGRCIQSVIEQQGGLTTEIIVIDNASEDGSADWVRRVFPGVRVHQNDRNLGFGRAVNQGARLAKGRFILLMNPDGYLMPDAIKALVEFARANPQYIVVGGRTLKTDGSHDPRSCWTAPTLWSVFCHAFMLSTLWPGSRIFDPEAMGWFARDQARPVDIVSGCLLLMSRDDWTRMGGFDERYFVYGEDADLCLRARALTGRRCAITPAARMVHAVSASSNSRAEKLELLTKARITLARTHLAGWRGALAARLIVFGVLLRAILARLGVSRGRSWLEVWERRANWRDGYVG